MKTTIFNIALLITACGQQPVSPETVTDSNTKATNAKNTSTAEQDEPTKIKGYLSNAFEVTVDGEKFGDSEAFYTDQIDRLTEEAVSNGYQDWKLTFDAEIGLADLKYGMDVFIAASDKKGYAGQTSMNYDGSFSVTIPEGARDSVYSLRAVKRVSVTLTPPDELRRTEKTVKWCYNLSADLRNVAVGDLVVLDNFSTRLTKYGCQVDRSGIAIPAKN